MQSFTKIEIVWIADALDDRADWLRDFVTSHENEMIASTCMAARLRADQLAAAAEKLRKAVENGNKRIEIKY